jgi:hypothetical protein
MRTQAMEFSFKETSVHGFREYYINIMNGDDMYPDELKPLIAAANTIIISTAECKRALSNMNIISSIRSSMFLKTASSLMLISLVGPPLSAFEAWIKKRRRHADYQSCAAPADRRPVSSENNESIWIIL